MLLDDETITGPITYEPDFLPDGRKIDFVVDRGNDNLYVEVKTVRPRTADTEEAWQKFMARRQHHPANVNFIVEKEWMGGAIYGNVFASRAHFLDYTRDFETRLAAAKAIKPGPGVLVFCGTGFAWHKSKLEDFADFYLTGVHRGDDAFALMKQHAIKEKKIKLLRNIDHFAYSAPPHGEAAEGRVSFSHSRPTFHPSAAQTLGAGSAVAAAENRIGKSTMGSARAEQSRKLTGLQWLILRFRRPVLPIQAIIPTWYSGLVGSAGATNALPVPGGKVRVV